MPTYNSKLHIMTWLKGVLPYLCNEYGVVPTIKKLATMKGCSQATMYKAIKQLEEDGLLISKRGYGTCLKNSQFQSNVEPKKDFQIIANDLPKTTSKQIYVLILPVYNYVKPYPNIITGYLSDFCQGVFEAAEKYQIAIVIKYFDGNLDNRRKSIRAILAYIKKNSIKGIMTSGIVGHDLFKGLFNTGLPCLIVDHWPLGLQIPSFNPNHFDAAKELVLVLASLKHKNIALIDRSDSSVNPKIMSGYKAGLAAANLGINEDLIFNVRINFLVRQNEERLINFEKLILGDNRPTAFITFSSEVAMELIKFIERLGLKVPRDFSIIAFCSHKVEFNDIILSGIFYDWKSIGSISVDKLLGISLRKEKVVFDDYFKYTFLPGNTISYNSFKPRGTTQLSKK